MTPWPATRLRRASVTSFGYGGANAHCILDHANVSIPGYVADELPKWIQDHVDYRIPNGHVSTVTCGQLETNHAHGSLTKVPHLVLLPFSTHDPLSLEKSQSLISGCLEKHALADLAYTLSERRTTFSHRTFRIVDSEAPRKSFADPCLPPEKCDETQVARPAFVFTGL